MRHDRWLRFAAVLFLTFTLPLVRSARACASDQIRVDLGFGAGIRAFGSPAADVRQYRLSLSPQLVVGDLGAIGPVFGMTRTDALLRDGAGLPISADLALPWSPTLGARFDAHVLRCDWFRLTLSAEYESQLGAVRSRVDALTPSSAFEESLARIRELLIQQGIPYAALLEDSLRGGFGTTHSWDIGQAELTLGAKYRFVEPTFGIGMLTFRQTTTIDVLPGFRQLLDEYDITLRTRFATDSTVPLLAPGVRVDLWGGAQLRLRGVWLSSKEFSFSTFEGAIFVPLDL